VSVPVVSNDFAYILPAEPGVAPRTDISVHSIVRAVALFCAPRLLCAFHGVITVKASPTESHESTVRTKIS
jgi:hypothetical protein